MSINNLKKFGKLCAEDETIRARVKEIGINNPEELIAYAGEELNLYFTHDDMTALAKEEGSSQKELSEEDLEKIAGGSWSVTADGGIGVVSTAGDVPITSVF